MNAIRTLRYKRFTIGSVGNDFAVADLNHGRVLFLNRTAGAAWLYLADGPQTLSSLEKEFRGMWPDICEELSDYLRELLNEWSELGWLDQVGPDTWRLADRPAKRDQHNNAPSDGAQSSSETSSVLWCRRIKLHRTVLDLEFRGLSTQRQTPEFQRLVGFFSGLPNDSTSQAAIPTVLTFEADGLCLEAGESTTRFADLSVASSVLIDQLVRICYPEVSAHTTLHAAAVYNASGCVLLPASSGSGKSTLTAFLVANGWTYGGDDIVGVARTPDPSANLVVLPFPTAIGVKDGSVPVLTSHYPSLRSLDVVTYGTKLVRYVPVLGPKHVARGDALQRPKVIVFPRYGTDSLYSVQQLSERDALAALLEAGAGRSSGLDFDNFELLLDLVKTVPSYRMQYSQLETAAAGLNELC